MVVLGVVVGCSPIARLKCRFDLPKGVAAPDATKLHLRVAAACPHYGGEPDPPPPPPPEPGMEEKPAWQVTAEALADAGDAGDADDAGDAATSDAGASIAADAGADLDAKGRRRFLDEAHTAHDGFEAEVTVRATHCWVSVTAWYDTNGNGQVDDADYVATLPGTLVRDRGLCAGNLTWAGPITMKPRGAAR